ncbi:hypothetical protein KIPB_010218 [Kipferlia bialata]|uniref:Uncharacterized protein n=1 Tax=Kipferlia bialata TaxID=797122 RepID=A0A9K3D655_9EUKA|nr:hypothetical protein KIPB_010218 [Kipferlia bialata]|eukprot:g10218.t1
MYVTLNTRQVWVKEISSTGLTPLAVWRPTTKHQALHAVPLSGHLALVGEAHEVLVGARISGLDGCRLDRGFQTDRRAVGACGSDTDDLFILTDCGSVYVCTHAVGMYKLESVKGAEAELEKERRAI